GPPRRQWPAETGSSPVGCCGPPLGRSAAGFCYCASGHAEPGRLQRCARGAPPAHRGPHAPRLVGPAAASEDPVVGVTARVEVVPAPLPDIAEQVREPEGIGAFPPDGLDPVDFVPGGPGDVTQPPVLRPGGAGTAGVLPLGL